MKRKLLVIAILSIGAFSFMVGESHAGRIAKFATAGRPKLGHRMKAAHACRKLRHHHPVIIVVAPKKASPVTPPIEKASDPLPKQTPVLEKLPAAKK